MIKLILLNFLTIMVIVIFMYFGINPLLRKKRDLLFVFSLLFLIFVEVFSSL